VVDEEVGRIVDALGQAGLRDDTIVVYTSDHGDMAGELGLWWKSSCYEGSARVPLLVSWPRCFPAGRRIADPVSLIDLAPTIVDLAGASALPSISGRVVTSLLRGEPLPDQTAPEIYVENVPGWAPTARMVRRGRHKLIRHVGFEMPQLFDLEADPGETTDLAGDPGQADVVADLDALVRAGWDPDAIGLAVDRHRAERTAVAAWAAATHPPDDAVWPRAEDPDLNRLSRLIQPGDTRK